MTLRTAPETLLAWALFIPLILIVLVMSGRGPITEDDWEY